MAAVTVSYSIIGEPDLLASESLSWYLNTDNNPATGSPAFGGGDYVVITLGRLGPDDPPELVPWNLALNQFDVAAARPLQNSGPFGFVASITGLNGMSPGTPVTLVGAASYKGLLQSHYDWTPDVTAAGQVPPFQFTPAFAAQAPAVAPPSAPTPTPGQAPATAVGPAPPSTSTGQVLGASRARAETAKALRRTYGRHFTSRRPGSYHVACRRNSRIKQTCRVSWRWTKYHYSGQVTVLLGASSSATTNVVIRRTSRPGGNSPTENSPTIEFAAGELRRSVARP
ncbi:MAG: hypothetical protein AB7I30_23050 [Isosphaeraceae bacterium]